MAVVGGGPGGLYAARLLKLRWPDCQVVVHEQSVPSATFGFGVGLAGRTQRRLEAADPDSLRDMVAAGYRYGSEMRNRTGAALVRAVHDGAQIGIARSRLLDILQRHAEKAGVEIVVGQRADAWSLDADLVIAADGVNSSARTARAQDFGAEVAIGDGYYLWAGTDFALPTAMFAPAETEHGTFVTHAYPYQPDRSTFLIETDADTLRRAGLGAIRHEPARDASDTVSLAYLEEAFAGVLEGHRLIGNRTQWLRFRTVRCARWHVDGTVLLGDAAHTAHYSIGSGTKIAMEGAIALVDALQRSEDLPTALTAYESERRPKVERLQDLAERSRLWWESFPQRLETPVERVTVAYMSRAGNVPLARFAQTNPEVVRRALADYAGRTVRDRLPDDPDRWVLTQPLQRDDLSFASRVVEHESLLADARFAELHHGSAPAWSAAGDRLLEQATSLHRDGITGFLLSGPPDRPAVLNRLDLAERIRLATGSLVAVHAPERLSADLAAGLVSSRIDLACWDIAVAAAAEPPPEPRPAAASAELG
ncbi:FAD-dependent monooxygenase [Actinomadura montaniterrae]|uniref:FAD-dependent monooxygenase n=1 Tax=Actinomadura montaniterrae TaxID=1803903 RepID=UPI001CEF98D2|nr:FAD-dependent monooxygenase [Actinomadura montaniterrae]